MPTQHQAGAYMAHVKTLHVHVDNIRAGASLIMSCMQTAVLCDIISRNCNYLYQHLILFVSYSILSRKTGRQWMMKIMAQWMNLHQSNNLKQLHLDKLDTYTLTSYNSGSYSMQKYKFIFNIHHTSHYYISKHMMI